MLQVWLRADCAWFVLYTVCLQCRPHAVSYTRCYVCVLCAVRFRLLCAGAERPSDFHTHVHAARMVGALYQPFFIIANNIFKKDLTQSLSGTSEAHQFVHTVDGRLMSLMDDAGFDSEWRQTWWHHLPSCYELAGGVNVRLIVWIYTLYASFGMLWYARGRYAQLENQPLVSVPYCCSDSLGQYTHFRHVSTAVLFTAVFPYCLTSLTSYCTSD